MRGEHSLEEKKLLKQNKIVFEKITQNKMTTDKLDTCSIYILFASFKETCLLIC